MFLKEEETFFVTRHYSIVRRFDLEGKREYIVIDRVTGFPCQYFVSPTDAIIFARAH